MHTTASHQGQQPLPFRAADLIRLELTLLGIRCARMNDLLTVRELLGGARIRPRYAASFALATGSAAPDPAARAPAPGGRTMVVPGGGVQ